MDDYDYLSVTVQIRRGRGINDTFGWFGSAKVDLNSDMLLNYDKKDAVVEGSGLAENGEERKIQPLMTNGPIDVQTKKDLCPDSNLTPQQRQYILYTHNRLRSKIALGRQPNREGMMGSGKNIYFLRWDCALELIARERSQLCSAYSTGNTTNLSGSQLVRQFDTFLHGTNTTKHIDDAMRSWWTEYKRYGNTDMKNRYFSKRLYYGWANMAKGKTTRIGCSYSSCRRKENVVFTCVYNEKTLELLPKSVKYMIYSCRAQVEQQTIYEPGNSCNHDEDCSTFPHSKCLNDIGLCDAPERQEDVKTNSMCTQVKTSMTDSLRQSVLDQHNFYRSRLAKGLEFNGLTNATQNGGFGMMKMEYDCELEWYAQHWADECKFEHSNRWERPNQGQNLYMTSFTNVQASSLLQMAIEMWWKELEYYGMPADAMISDSVWTRMGSLVGHFTQMAWGSSFRLGCAIGNCAKMRVVVCHYSPALVATLKKEIVIPTRQR
ncbi:unnamed protein product [Nippostrongylus brasiliensis]|uniref:SCP domain-containing protein n=1 Tax=Nippostrongylus brasiliensis TaxID=27835 RepID=A0A158QWX0_NIPBR|nr:unnamed protein product [Nippostrongylus brasiliensis]